MEQKFALAIKVLSDRRFRQATRVWFAMFLWIYQPGRVCRETAKSIGAEVGLEPRTCERATAELKKAGYLSRADGGWICPLLDHSGG